MCYNDTLVIFNILKKYMSLSELINKAGKKDIIRYSSSDIEENPTSADGYKYQNKEIEELYQKTHNYSESLNTSAINSSKDDIAIFARHC